MTNKKYVPSPCKKDCPDRFVGCKLECKRHKIYEKLKRYKTNQTVLFNEVQDNNIKEYNGYRFLRSGKIKGIYVDDLKTTDTGSIIKVSLNDNGVAKTYSLNKLIYKIFNGKSDFNDSKIKIVHKDGNYKNCSFDNLVAYIK